MFLSHCIALSVDATLILIVETMFSSQNNVFLLHFLYVLNVPSLYISFYDFILCSLVHLYTRFFIDRCNHLSVLLFLRSFCHCPISRHNVTIIMTVIYLVCLCINFNVFSETTRACWWMNDTYTLEYTLSAEIWQSTVYARLQARNRYIF